MQFLVCLGKKGKILRLRTKTYGLFLGSLLLMTGTVKKEDRTSLEGMKDLAGMFFSFEIWKIWKLEIFILQDLSYLLIS